MTISTFDWHCTFDLEVRIVLIFALLLDLRLEIDVGSLSLSLRTPFLLRYKRVVVGVIGVVADASLVNGQNLIIFLSI